MKSEFHALRVIGNAIMLKRRRSPWFELADRQHGTGERTWLQMSLYSVLVCTRGASGAVRSWSTAWSLLEPRLLTPVSTGRTCSSPLAVRPYGTGMPDTSPARHSPAPSDGTALAS